MIISSAVFKETNFGTEYIKMPLLIRNDVEQKFQNAFIWHTIWNKKDAEDCDLEWRRVSGKTASENL